MYSLGQVYVGKIIPFIIKISAGGTVYPRIKVIRPDLTIDLVALAPYVDSDGNVIDTTLYSGIYPVNMEGPYTFTTGVYDDDLYLTDVTLARLTSDGFGSFSAVNSVWDDLIIDHKATGSAGEFLQKILDYLFLYENSGDGSCPLQIKVKNGGGVAFRVVDIQTGNTLYARGTLNSFGQATVYLDKGNYRVEFYPPCGKVMEKAYEIVNVNCNNSNIGSNC